MEKASKNKALVFLDVSIDGDPFKRMIFELFTDDAPKTAENFRALCTGEKGVSLKTGKPLHYKGTFFHRIIKGHVAEAGDLLRKNGEYGESIYGGKFPDEPPKLRHDGPGLLSMAITDRDEKGSLFIVTFEADHRLDRKRVVFGKLVDGYEVLKMIENAGDDNGIPAVMIKIVNSGELHDDKLKENMLKMGKDTTVEDNNEVKRKRKHRKSSRKTRKRRRYYTSESDSSTDDDSESSESDTDSDSDASSLSDSSSSSDERRKRRKRSKRVRHRHGKRGRRHEKRRRKREKKSKRKSKRDSSSLDKDAVGVSDVKHKTSGNQSPIAEQENKKVSHKKGKAADMSEREEGEFPRENGDHLNNHNGVDYEREDDRHPDVVDDLESKSRSGSLSPMRTRNTAMIISPRIAARSEDVAAKHNRSRSPSVSRSPRLISESRSRSRSRSRSSQSISRSRSRSPSVSRIPQPISRSRSNTPARNESRKSPLRTKRERSSRLTLRSRSASISPIRGVTRSPPPRISYKRSSSSRSRSRSRPARKSASRVSGRAQPRRSPSPVRAPRRSRRSSHSGSPVSASRRAKSPVSVRGRSSSRSPSFDGSPKRIRRGRGFSDRYSYVRRFRSQSRSPDRSPVRTYRYGGRMDRDRYPSYRRSPRRYRSPPRARTPPRHRGRRSRTRSPSASRSPIRYRGRRYSRSPYRSRSPVERHRSPSPRVLKRRSPSLSKSQSLSSRGSQSPRHAVSARSRSSSGSPPAGKANLVSYGDGSPDSGRD